MASYSNSTQPTDGRTLTSVSLNQKRIKGFLISIGADVTETSRGKSVKRERKRERGW